MSRVSLNGVHHVTCITGDAPGNVEFYVGVLGMRLVKKTVNQDDPSVYHLFYGDEKGSPGFDLTFFEYPSARRGRAGAGMVHRIVWRLPSPESLEYWQGRLEAAGTATERSDDGLLFDDPEGLTHEFLVYDGPEEFLRPAHSEVPPEFAIGGFHGVRAYSSAPDVTEKVLSEVLDFEDGGDGAWSVSGESRSGLYILDPAPDEGPIPGAGTVHHVAWATRVEDQDEWQSYVSGAGLHATPVIDRFYFRAIYFREPGGVLFELATMGPGFATDEPAESLGERLSLPPDFEALRDQVEPRLKVLPDVRQWRPAES
jgi:glyoxalase family protein